MIVVENLVDLRAQCHAWRRAGEGIAFVPTMGNLHAGHLSLMRRARGHGSRVVASIYVNPMQFDRTDDFNAYPRTAADDLRALENESVDLAFCPRDEEMYPRPVQEMTYVQVPVLGELLEGELRPGHFRGVATVVTRLFNLVQPDVAVFGKKDYQQLLLIRQVVSDLGLPVGIVGVETVREQNGLAMSSRNKYLTKDERARAAALYTALENCRRRLHDGECVYSVVEKEAAQTLVAAGFRPEYISIRRQQDLAVPVDDDRDLVIVAAAWLGKARLIDNVEVSLNQPH